MNHFKQGLKGSIRSMIAGHKINACPKAAWNQNRSTPANQSRPPVYAPQGRLPAP